MFLRRLSIQWKITLLAGLCLLGVVALLVGLSVYRMQHSSVLVKSASTQMLDESARLRLEAAGNCRRYASSAISWMPSSTARASPGRSCSSATRRRSASSMPTTCAKT